MLLAPYKSVRTIALTTALVVLAGCTKRVGSSALVTNALPYRGKVQLTALEVPNGAVEIGPVKAYGLDGNFNKIIAAFAARVAKTGGDVGKIDSIRTKFEYKLYSIVETYDCGSANAPEICSRTVSRIGEVGTTTVLGRAFRSGEHSPIETTPSPLAPDSNASGARVTR